MPEFQWQPLASQKYSLRLIRIEPGKIDDPIHCTLRHVDTEANLVNHVCLSYQCGPDSPQEQILINGQCTSVRVNLWKFLVTARRYKVDAWLWIDALSIHQTDLREKNHQVSRMGEIYRSAERTIIWTDLSDKHALDLLKLQDFLDGEQPDVQQVPKQVWERFCSAYETSRKQRSFKDGAIVKSEYVIDEVFKLNEHLRPEFAEILQRYLSMDPALEATAWSLYWSRAWIVQELLLSRRPEFMSPERSVRVPLVVLYLSDWLWLLWARSNGGRYPNAEGVNIRLKKDDILSKWNGFSQMRRELIKRQGIFLKHEDEAKPLALSSIENALNLVRERNCQDIRDCIYSATWLAEDWGGRFPIDYTASVERISWQVIDFHERSSKNEHRTSIFLLFKHVFDNLHLQPPEDKQLENLEQVQQVASDASDDEQCLHWIYHVGRVPRPPYIAAALLVLRGGRRSGPSYILVIPVEHVRSGWRSSLRNEEIEEFPAK